jgi:hypothetical protein
MTKTTGAFLRDCSNAPKNGQHKYSNVFRLRVFSHCRAASTVCVEQHFIDGTFRYQLKGEARPRTGREGTEGGRHGSILSLASALYEGGQRHAPATLLPVHIV